MDFNKKLYANDLEKINGGGAWNNEDGDGEYSVECPFCGKLDIGGYKRTKSLELAKKVANKHNSLGYPGHEATVKNNTINLNDMLEEIIKKCGC